MSNSTNKHRLRKLAGDSRYISGIYNYCDRWCQRCELKERCLTYALERETFGADAVDDVSNPQFWGKLSDMFHEALAMLQDAAREMDLDLDSVDEKAVLRELRNYEKKADRRKSLMLAKRYASLVGDYYAKHETELKQKETALIRRHALEIPGAADEAALIKDALGTIGWYRYFIYAKLRRATAGRLQETVEKTGLRDHEGSAKIALIAIDKSLAAWQTMYSTFPGCEDIILTILALLSKLKKGVEKEFPAARAFKRPGFDQ